MANDVPILSTICVVIELYEILASMTGSADYRQLSLISATARASNIGGEGAGALTSRSDFTKLLLDRYET